MARPKEKDPPPPKEAGEKGKPKGLKLDPGTWGADLADVAAQEGGEVLAKKLFDMMPKALRVQFRTGGIAGRAVLNLVLSRFLPKVPFLDPLRLELVSTVGRLAMEEYEREQHGESGKPEETSSEAVLERPRLDYGKARTNINELMWFADMRDAILQSDDDEMLEEFDRMVIETLNSRSGGQQKKGGNNGGRKGGSQGSGKGRPRQRP